MQLHLLAVGERVPAWVETGFAEYAGRMPRECKLTLREIPAGRRTKGADIARLLREEGERLLAAVPKGARIVALDRQGRELSTEDLATEVKAQMARGGDLALLIGGPEGLSTECLAQAQARWSLSRLTLAHPLVRVVVAEQVYRAWSILNNLPYHR
ncbi:MAG: 23S rRNA (pseudouridine(1915)-N(3))-methyltransferase RlmH [Gammaproteobacteria bacterium]|nr:23S rRNA (pseudouridine(1915)-N(3))-methyltransferase RlmH [Gammaproteobacteria bacterium]